MEPLVSQNLWLEGCIQVRESQLIQPWSKSGFPYKDVAEKDLQRQSYVEIMVCQFWEGTAGIPVSAHRQSDGPAMSGAFSCLLELFIDQKINLAVD